MGPRPGDAGEVGRVVITASGANRPGIVAVLSKVLADAQVDIVDLSQKVVEELFVMLIVADLSASRVPILELRDRLQAAARGLGIQVAVQHEKLYRAVYRV